MTLSFLPYEKNSPSQWERINYALLIRLVAEQKLELKAIKNDINTHNCNLEKESQIYLHKVVNRIGLVNDT